MARTDDTPQIKDLKEIIAHVKPHILIGLTGGGPAFDQARPFRPQASCLLLDCPSAACQAVAPQRCSSSCSCLAISCRLCPASATRSHCQLQLCAGRDGGALQAHAQAARLPPVEPHQQVRDHRRGRVQVVRWQVRLCSRCACPPETCLLSALLCLPAQPCCRL